MRVQRYQKDDQPIWDDFVRTSKNGTFLFLRNYMDYHRSRFEDHSLLIHDEKKRLLAILVANQNGYQLDSHGGLTYGGLVTGESMKTPIMLATMNAVLTYAKEAGFTSIRYKTIPHIYHKAPAEEDLYALYLINAKVTNRSVITAINMRNRLPFQERRKRGATKARASGVEVQQSAELVAYWALLTEVLQETYNTVPVHTVEEIQRLQAAFPENIRLFTAQHKDEILAGVLLYETDRVVRAQYIATSAKGKALGALDLLFDHLLNNVCANKDYFEFGTSEAPGSNFLNAGLVDQKEGFGARAVMHDHYTIQLDYWQPDAFRKAYSG